METQSDLVYWLALSDSPLSVRITMKYYGDFGSLEGLWTAPEAFLRTLGADEAAIHRFVEFRGVNSLASYHELLATLVSKKIRTIRITDLAYPALLRTISGPPPNEPPLLIHIRGQIQDYDKCVAVVGTRQCSRYGSKMSREIGRGLATSGYTVVSGLARGIDTQAHSGALDVDGRTVAVLAWMYPVYPPENSILLEQIVRNGSAISERYRSPRGQGRYLFVARNRIISGISRALVIAESAKTGGTAWQFDFAKEQGTPIFVLEPKESPPLFVKGYEHFVGRGAIPVRSADDLIEKMKAPTKLDSYA
jgi:DNA processing protein